mmetsp:Transcript_28070/g.74179  ORF Transcript_28070/g.74179 Transcript_28070/m.74179 type:complete len:240 (-) Transcript_28070:739-1458(-)
MSCRLPFEGGADGCEFELDGAGASRPGAAGGVLRKDGTGIDPARGGRPVETLLSPSVSPMLSSSPGGGGNHRRVTLELRPSRSVLYLISSRACPGKYGLSSKCSLATKPVLIPEDNRFIASTTASNLQETSERESQTMLSVGTSMRTHCKAGSRFGFSVRVPSDSCGCCPPAMFPRASSSAAQAVAFSGMLSCPSTSPETAASSAISEIALVGVLHCLNMSMWDNTSSRTTSTHVPSGQ